MRRSRHCRDSAESSISAMLSQDPCLGVWWISRRWARAKASPGSKASYSEATAVGVEVVHDQHHGVSVGVVDGQEFFHLPGPVDLGALGQGVHAAPPLQGLGPHEDRAGAAPDVFAVLAGIPARLGRERVSDVAE
jgi:hypothetical protein